MNNSQMSAPAPIHPTTESEWIQWRSDATKAQTKINDQIQIAFDKIMSIGFQMDTDFWDDYLHSPEDIDGSSTDQRWNENTLRCMQADIEQSA